MTSPDAGRAADALGVVKAGPPARDGIAGDADDTRAPVPAADTPGSREGPDGQDAHAQPDQG